MRRIEIHRSVRVLEKNITRIQTVGEWAEEMGYASVSYFSRKFRNHYGVRPKQILVRKKLDKVKQCMNESPGDIYFSIARKAGFIDNNALYKFIKLHTGKSVTEFKREYRNRVRKKSVKTGSIKF